MVYGYMVIFDDVILIHLLLFSCMSRLYPVYHTEPCFLLTHNFLTTFTFKFFKFYLHFAFTSNESSLFYFLLFVFYSQLLVQNF